jgi:lysophospholipase L1-like esterase
MGRKHPLPAWRRREAIGRSILVAAVCLLAVPAMPTAAGAYRPSPCRAAHASSVLRHPIVTFGDSITWGIGATVTCMPGIDPPITPAGLHLPGPHDTTYPADLSRLIRLPVLNYGVPGEQAIIGYSRLPRVLSALHPSVVLILEGVNDLHAGYTPSAAATRLGWMVKEVQDAHARPILLTLTRTYFPPNYPEPATNGKVAQLSSIIRHLGPKLHVPVVDLYDAFPPPRGQPAVMRQPNGGEDYLHPNDAGYRLIARTIASQTHDLRRTR